MCSIVAEWNFFSSVENYTIAIARKSLTEDKIHKLRTLIQSSDKYIISGEDGNDSGDSVEKQIENPHVLVIENYSEIGTYFKSKKFLTLKPGRYCQYHPFPQQKDMS